MWLLFYIVIGIFSLLGLVFLILMCLPNTKFIEKKEFSQVEFEIETNRGLYRGKLRYKISK